MTRTLSPSDRSIAAGIAQATAHGITRTGFAKVSGRHLSQALNDPSVNDRGDSYPYATDMTVLRDMAVEAQLANMEDLGGWIESMSSERLPSAYFGPISTEDLIAKILFNDRANAEQVLQAVRELKDRYLTEFAPDVADHILALQARSNHG